VRSSRRILLITLAGAVLASAGVGVGFAAMTAGGAPSSAADRYGTLPGFLPKTTLDTDATEVGTSAHPALTSQGDAVRATLPDGRSVSITVAGPETPGEGLPFQAGADTATWTVTLRDASGTIPIRTRAFSAIDSFGKVYRLNLVPGQPRPPAAVHPGQSVSFELRNVMRVGEGDLRWAPADNDLLATWDFVVEND
jgi:hypothetical protein